MALLAGRRRVRKNVIKTAITPSTAIPPITAGVMYQNAYVKLAENIDSPPIIMPIEGFELPDEAPVIMPLSVIKELGDELVVDDGNTSAIDSRPAIDAS